MKHEFISIILLLLPSLILSQDVKDVYIDPNEVIDSTAFMRAVNIEPDSLTLLNLDSIQDSTAYGERAVQSLSLGVSTVSFIWHGPRWFSQNWLHHGITIKINSEKNDSLEVTIFSNEKEIAFSNSWFPERDSVWGHFFFLPDTINDIDSLDTVRITIHSNGQIKVDDIQANYAIISSVNSRTRKLIGKNAPAIRRTIKGQKVGRHSKYFTY